MSEHLRVAIIGAGFAGIGMAIKLQRANAGPYLVFERAGRIGGTWRENHYPGCCCDVPSHVYSYSFDLNKGWSRGFAPQWEILSYLEQTASQRDSPHPLQPRGSAGDCDEAAHRWIIDTSQGAFTADILVNAGGALSDPKAPEIPGIEGFTGKMFHSAQWDQQHTWVMQGDPQGIYGDEIASATR